MSPRVKYSLFFLALAGGALFWNAAYRFDPVYSTYADTFNMYFIPGLADPSLFGKDGVVAALREAMKNPWTREFTFFWYYARASQAMPLHAAVKLTALLLVLLSAALTYRRAEAQYGGDRPAFFFTIATMSYFLLMDSFYYGQNRAFGACLFFLLIYALHAGRYCLAPLFVYLFFIVYPYLALPAALISGIAAFRVRPGAQRVFYLCALLLAAALTALTDISFDAGVNQATAFGYKLKGLYGGPIDPRHPWDMLLHYVLNLNEHRRTFAIATVLLAAFTAAAAWVRGRDAFSALRGPLALPLAMFPLSFALLYPFNPLFASRQLVFAVPFALVTLFADNALFFLKGRRLAAAASAIAAVFIAANPFYSRIEDFRPYAKVYPALAGLPKTALIAGAPGSRLAASVPFYAKRAVYYTDITAEVMSAALPALDQAALRAELEEALCASPAAAAAFAGRRGIDYLLVETPGPWNKHACGGRESGLLAAAKSGAHVFSAETAYGQVFLVKPAEAKR